MKASSKLKHAIKQKKKQIEFLARLREKHPDLPDDVVPAIREMRKRLGFDARRAKLRSHASVMANFDAIFRRLGIHGKASRGSRKPTAQLHAAVSGKFLESYEWRKLRYRALIRYGRRCQCCGRSPTDGVQLNVDHIKPRRKYPELALNIDNLQVLCHECNHGKGNWDETDWRDEPDLRVLMGERMA